MKFIVVLPAKPCDVKWFRIIFVVGFHIGLPADFATTSLDLASINSVANCASCAPFVGMTPCIGGIVGGIITNVLARIFAFVGPPFFEVVFAVLAAVVAKIGPHFFTVLAAVIPFILI